MKILLMKLITLTFITPFSIGEKENYVDAITLYRAFIKALSLLGEPFDDILEGKVKFSSAFPVYKEKLFLRMPYRTIKCEDRAKEKQLRKIGYLNSEVLEKIPPPYTIECRKDGDYIVGKDGEMMLGKESYLVSYGDFIVDYKNRMDRLNNSADIYSISAFIPHTDVGFLATSWDNRLERALKLLEKLGIGKDRNLGYGKFKVKGVKDFDIKVAGNEYKYATGRVYTEGEFLAERFDRLQIIGGDSDVVLHSLLVLLPVGSLVKEVKRLKIEKGNNVVIVDPVVI